MHISPDNRMVGLSLDKCFEDPLYYNISMRRSAPATWPRPLVPILRRFPPSNRLWVSPTESFFFWLRPALYEPISYGERTPVSRCTCQS